MKQYLELLKEIKEKGTYKPAAREGMPGTQSLFGYQFRHNLADGFPLLTTKEIFWKGVVVELLWFLKGDTNIKYLIDNGVNIWNEDAYNYYCKLAKSTEEPNDLLFEDINENRLRLHSLEEFKTLVAHQAESADFEYTYGDCGFQYGKVWREWNGEGFMEIDLGSTMGEKLGTPVLIDQIKNLIHSLKNTPESRRHIVTAIDPAHDQDLALYWCHAMFQFNCRPLTHRERCMRAVSLGFLTTDDSNQKVTVFPKRESWFIVREEDKEDIRNSVEWDEEVKNSYNKITLNDLMNDKWKIPKYYLDCQLYQRSADVVLGVPFNIASYALLTEILAKICNMIPGEFIHTFGDVHIYDNHKEAVEEQLKRTPTKLPKLKLEIEDDFEFLILEGGLNYNYLMEALIGYNPQSKIKAKLSTGLK